MILVTDGSNQPGELILPIVQGWNEVTLVYNGRDMHGMVNNWQGEKKTSIPMRGNIQSRPEGISLGYCPKYDGLQGKIDDFAFYECIPLAIQNKIGRSQHTRDDVPSLSSPSLCQEEELVNSNLHFSSSWDAQIRLR